MRLPGLVAAGSLVTGLAVVLALVLVGSGPGGDGRSLSKANFSLERARAFDEFQLYSAGERVDGLPLTAVLRRDDTADYVSFVYGDCVADDGAGCAPPAEIQVWRACRRSLALYNGVSGESSSHESVVARGVPGAFFDRGTRLELQTGWSTVVVFAESRLRVLRIVAALRAVDGSVPAGVPLPPPAPDAIGVPMDC